MLILFSYFLDYLNFYEDYAKLRYLKKQNKKH